jgi:hypothetical protein
MDPFTGNNQDPQSLHKYLYAHCNPINNIDPSGEQLGGGTYNLSDILIISAIMGIMAGVLTYNYTGSLKAALIVGVSAFVLTFIAMGGIGVLYAAVTGGTVSSPHLLNPNSWQEAEGMLGKVLRLPKNTLTYYVEGMTKGRRPDFIDMGRRFIADSKWREYVYRTPQLEDFVTLAKKWEVPLYIFVRQSTKVSAMAVELIESTGGYVIEIFKG